MIKHVVLFKFNNPDKSYLDKVIRQLLNLKSSIPAVINIEAGINVNNNEAYHVALEVIIKNWDDLELYVKHPEHIKVSGLIRERLADRACVDFQI